MRVNIRLVIPVIGLLLRTDMFVSIWGYFNKYQNFEKGGVICHSFKLHARGWALLQQTVLNKSIKPCNKIKKLQRLLRNDLLLSFELGRSAPSSVQ